MSEDDFVKLENIAVTYGRKEHAVTALDETNLRIGIGLSWLAIVAAEMLIGGVGIGFFIWDAWNSSHISEIILALVYVGVIGFVLDRIVAGISTAVTHGTAAN